MQERQQKIQQQKKSTDKINVAVEQDLCTTENKKIKQHKCMQIVEKTTENIAIEIEQTTENIAY